MNKVTGKRDFRAIKIYINELLHFEMLIESYDAVQSWAEGSNKNMYFIQFYRKTGNPIKLEYENKDTWVEILKIIDENF